VAEQGESAAVKGDGTCAESPRIRW
jgi:hypothetical protein